ncbi:MAG: NAD-dependent epimerase/dehydratase family protein [Beijerinckiaceae bacterium]
MSLPLIALTGGSGFIGSYLADSLQQKGYPVRLLVRQIMPERKTTQQIIIGDLQSPINLSDALRGVDYVVHAAGIAHAAKETETDIYQRINTVATLHLAEAAERHGVRRFIYLSSIRAQSGPWNEIVLDESCPPSPSDAYGRSKLSAESGLAQLKMDWAALRPVLVYGANAKGNVGLLIRLAGSPWPLPLASILARRSLVSISSLASAVHCMIVQETPLRRPLIVAEPDALTTGEMLAALRHGMGKSAQLWPCPLPLLNIIASVIGKKDVIGKVSRPLIACSDALQALGWRPSTTSKAGLESLGMEYRHGRV